MSFLESDEPESTHEPEVGEAEVHQAVAEWAEATYRVTMATARLVELGVPLQKAIDLARSCPECSMLQDVEISLAWDSARIAQEGWDEVRRNESPSIENMERGSIE
jgi:hypothetical protein